MAKSSKVTPSVNRVDNPPAADAPPADWASWWLSIGAAPFPLHGQRDDGSCTCDKRADCGNPGKHPVTRDCPERSGYAEFPSERELRRYWSETFPAFSDGIEPNIGLMGGHLPHAQLALVFTDEDDTEATDALTEAATWTGALDTVQTTLKQLSGGRGRPHRLFACPSGTHIKSGKRSTMKGETPEQWGSLDVKAEGGYVVAAGSSIVRDGERRRYVLDNPGASILPLPHSLVGESSPFVIREGGSRFEERQGKVSEAAAVVEPESEEERLLQEAFKRWLATFPVLTGSGERDDTVAKVLAPHAHDLGLSADAATALIQEHWNGRDGQDPLPFDQIEKCVRSGYRSSQNEAGCRMQEVLDYARAGEHLRPLVEGARDPRKNDAPFGEAANHDPDSASGTTAGGGSTDSGEKTAGVQDVGAKLLPCYLEGELDALPAWSWLIDDVLPERSLHMIHGQPDALKTFTAIDLVFHGAAARPWPSPPPAADWTKPTPIKRYKPARQLRVAYLATEGVAGLRKRVRAWKKHHGVEQDLAVAFLPDCPTLDYAANLDSVIHTLKHVLGAVDWVVVDTLFGVAGEIDVTKATDSALLVKRFKAIMVELGCSLTIIHHDVKGTGGFFGSQVWYASVDAMDECKSEYLEPGVRGVKVTNEKTKDDTKRPTITLNARVEDLGQDDRGRRQSTLVLVADLQMANKTEEQTDPDTNRLNIALDLLEGERLAPVDWLAESIAAREQGQERFREMSDGDKAKMTDSVKRWLRREAKNRLASYANKASKAQNAPWEFCDPKLTPIRKGG